MPARIDMTGNVCGQLTVIARDTSDPRQGVRWLCQCTCGNTAIVIGTRLRSGHTRSCGCLNAMGSRRRSEHERFLEKTQLVESGCIEWTGGLNGVGYGQFYRGGRKGAGETGKGYAHRYAYEYFVGPIPYGYHLDHLCRNRKCVNPKHLEPVTPRENLLRGVGASAQHAKKTHCPEGHPYAGDNLYVHPRKNMRYCRTCGRIRAKAKRDRILQEKAAS